MYVYDDGPAYKVRYSYFIYKGAQYNISDYDVVINGDVHTIEKFEVCRTGSIDFRTRAQNRQLDDIIGTQEDIDAAIEAVVPKIVTPPEVPQHDHPNAFSIGEGTAIYVVIMLLGTIFVDRWFIWIAATVIFLNWKSKKPKWKK